ncbi:sensor histidine kinase [Streptococcus sp. DD12]|uniref:sensor histidine kinase n=1 Tax=Streptococcus sp. DD12 TaxID=1777880 RepID=UPI0007920027|nr:sensor histidine kinase [Streptococcus sp. DD12]KXT75967.1 Sensor histidine kinase VraS [Streptococcus sp. DD12]
MRRSQYLVIIGFAVMTMGSIVLMLLDGFGMTFAELTKDPVRLMRLLFSLVFLTFSLVILLLFLCVIIQEGTRLQFNRKLKRILNNQSITTDETEIGKNLQRLSRKLKETTSNLQRTQNERIEDSQVIIAQERTRLARDLHDTVSQELFAASMMLSGLSENLDQVPLATIKEQITVTRDVLDSAQNDLRVMLLHLRPTELQGRSLVQGLEMILQELRDKNALKVLFEASVTTIPKTIEDNLFRIAQEFISNTLKHAKASQLEVYVTQDAHRLTLKMVDDGQGFDPVKVAHVSYGLKNIEDRVNDMAGQLRFISTPGKGTAMTIQVPLIEGDDDDRDSDDRIISG